MIKDSTSHEDVENILPVNNDGMDNLQGSTRTEHSNTQYIGLTGLLEMSNSTELHNSNETTTVTNANNISRSQDLPRYYQVATPKSPYDILSDDFSNNISLASSADSRLLHSLSMPDIHDSNRPLIPSSRESEDIERLKYETAKSELMDKLNLHILLNHKEKERINKELKRVDAQMTLIEKMHDDSELLNKIENYNQRKIEEKRKLLAIQNRNNNNSVSFNDNTLSSASNIPQHHYHTRSKSHGNLLDNSSMMEFIDSPILNSRTVKRKESPINISIDPIDGSSNIQSPDNSNTSNVTTIDGYKIQDFKPNQMNMHHKRNYVTPCLSNNSGVVGLTEKNEPIFRRYDGILVIISCSFCERSNFRSAQGIVNHIRQKHNRTYASQALTVLYNQALLPNDKQDPKILNKFERLNMNPQTEYLPYDIAIPSMKSKTSNYATKEQAQKVHQVKTTPKEEMQSTDNGYATNHLQNLYQKDDFEDLITLVKGAKEDLNIVLQQPSGSDNSSESEGEEDEDDAHIIDHEDIIGVKDEDESDDDYKSSNSEESVSSPENTTQQQVDIAVSTEGSSSPSIDDGVSRRVSLRKRKASQLEELSDSIPLKERLRTTDKRLRAKEAVAPELPENERRSRHYNLRAKSKLRSSSIKNE